MRAARSQPPGYSERESSLRCRVCQEGVRLRPADYLRLFQAGQRPVCGKCRRNLRHLEATGLFEEEAAGDGSR